MVCNDDQEQKECSSKNRHDGSLLSLHIEGGGPDVE